jgi:hypothetical protein
MSDGLRLDVEKYCHEHGREISGVKVNNGYTLYLLKECVFDPNHKGKDAAIGQADNGALFYQCFHDSCKGKKWRDAKERISGKDDLSPFMKSDLSNCPTIYSTGKKDSSENQDQDKISYLDPGEYMRTGQEIQDLQCAVTWVWDKQIPEQSITLLSAKGGTGKTWLSLGILDAVSRGVPYLGLKTKQMPIYYIDFENPLPVLRDRVKEIGITGAWFWHNGDTPPPPKIDSSGFSIYKRFPPGLIFFDTLRASQSQDENDSRHMAMVMGRLKELRGIGFTVVILHHTPKSNDRTYKGSTAIFDLSDHVLGLYRVKKGTTNEIVEDNDDEDEEKTFRIGTKEKTRYEPFHMFIRFSPGRGFEPAPDPDTEIMEAMWDVLLGKGKLTQLAAFEEIRDTLSIKSKQKVVRLLGKGEGHFWDVFKDGKKKLYEARATVQVSTPIYRETIGQMNETKSDVSEQNQVVNSEKTVDEPVLSNCPSTLQTDKTVQEIPDKSIESLSEADSEIF